MRLEDIILQKDARGYGLGTRIINKIIDVCRAHGLDLNLSASPLSDHGTLEREAEFMRLLRL